MSTSLISIEEMLANALDGVVAIDRSRRVVVFSEGCERITGFRREEVLGFACRCHDILACRDKQGRSLAGALCPARALFEGVTDSARQRMCIRRKDGAQSWIETNYTVIRDQSGEVEFVLGVMRDVNEAKSREDDLLAEMSDLRERVRRLGEQQAAEYGFGNIVSKSPAMAPNDADALRLDPYLARVEREAILRALKAAGGQRLKAARLMEISRSRLYRRMDALGVRPDEHNL
ncbi:MAG: PAS domain S-box protein [Phycisphaerae bacterium]